MELGKAKLRRNGVNNLRNAIHREHGLIWSDGKGIYLAPVQLNHDQKLDNAASLRLGEFENVQSVHWSSSVEGGGCYMAAVHQSNISVWHVSGTVPHLAFKQVRKINVQPIPQGCLWNPKSDILCLLSRQQCSFYFRHMHNRRSFAFPSLENGKISCGCWSPDGKRLVICVGTALLIYTWTDVEGSISDFVTAAWRIPGVSGNITAIVPTSESSVVCTSDLPLDVLCTNSQDSFTFPGMRGSEPRSDGIICPNGASSVKDSLLNLQPSSKTPVQDAAMLSVIQLRSGVHDPIVLTSSIVPALLSPDLLHFQVESQCVVVGSNTQCELLVFTLLDSQLLCAGHLTLEKEQRPKGICGPPVSQASGSHGILVLVGKAEAVDPTFLSTNNTAVFSLFLKFFPTEREKARQVPNGLVTPIKTSSASVRKPETQYETQIKSVSDSKLLSKVQPADRPRQTGEEENGDDFRIRPLPSQAASRDCESKLVEDITDSSQGVVQVASSKRQGSAPQLLETERVDFSQSAPKFSNSVLSNKYEMNWKEEVTQESSVNDTLSVASDVLHSEVRKSEKTSKLSNGHTCGDKADPKCLLPNKSVERSVKDSSLGAQQTVSPPASGFFVDRGGKQSGDDGGSVCSSLNSSDSNYEILEKQIQAQRDQIDALQKRLADLSVMVQETACVFPIRYQKITEPEAVTVQCVVGGKRVSRKFLLDNGRLQLDPVKLAFGLLTVELVLDGEPLVLGVNIDGYIPIRFSPGSVLQVTGIPVAYSPQLKAKTHKEEPSLT